MGRLQKRRHSTYDERHLRGSLGHLRGRPSGVPNAHCEQTAFGVCGGREGAGKGGQGASVLMMQRRERRPWRRRQAPSRSSHRPPPTPLFSHVDHCPPLPRVGCLRGHAGHSWDVGVLSAGAVKNAPPRAGRRRGRRVAGAIGDAEGRWGRGAASGLPPPISSPVTRAPRPQRFRSVAACTLRGTTIVTRPFLPVSPRRHLPPGVSRPLRPSRASPLLFYE